MMEWDWSVCDQLSDVVIEGDIEVVSMFLIIVVFLMICMMVEILVCFVVWCCVRLE